MICRAPAGVFSARVTVACRPWQSGSQPVTSMKTNSIEFDRGGTDRHAAYVDTTVADPMATARNVLLQRLRGKAIRIYEAGGGSLSPLPQELLRNAEITVVDIAENQLRENHYATVKICGDIQLQQFPPDSFDLIVCHNVIEHLERPDRAIANFFNALKPGGLVFIAAPNPQSISGLAARFTPHWFHVLFYRVVRGAKEAGKAGKAPFPVFYSPLVTPQRLIEFCRRLGYEVVHFNSFEGGHLLILTQRYPVLGRIFCGAVRVAELILRKNLRLGDFHVIFEKPSNAR